MVVATERSAAIGFARANERLVHRTRVGLGPGVAPSDPAGMVSGAVIAFSAAASVIAVFLSVGR
jgi:hypothetical protein